MENLEQPLVSVPVITYNSSKTVIETLDSIYNQTYPNIELIISDDCSTDETISICRRWIEQHKERFSRTEILTVAKNTGVSANMNRAERACTAEWVKGIAGDDLLLPNCIETYIEYVTKHPTAVQVFSRIEVFGGDEERRRRTEKLFKYDFFDLTLEQQYERLMFEGNCLPASTNFYNKKAIAELGIEGYDERIPLLEDLPRWINLIKAGVHFQFIDMPLVRYRVSENSLSTQFEGVSRTFRKSSALFYIYYVYPEEYRRSDNKREVFYKYLCAQKVLHNKNIIWKVICKSYKILLLHRM